MLVLLYQDRHLIVISHMLLLMMKVIRISHERVTIMNAILLLVLAYARRSTRKNNQWFAKVFQSALLFKTGVDIFQFLTQ